MAAEALHPLLDRVREIDTRRETDKRSRYGKLVLRVARGDDLGGPEQIVAAVGALGREVDEFQEDVVYVCERIELKAVADQLAALTAAREVAYQQQQAAEAERAAELRKLEEAHAVKVAAARDQYQAATRRAEEAGRAARRLVDGCRDEEARDRLHENVREQAKLRPQIAAHRATARDWADKADVAARIERQELAQHGRSFPPASFGSPVEPVLPDTAGRKHRLELIRVAPEGIAEAERKAAALETRLAELVAEANDLEARLAEPWPLSMGSRG